MDTSKEKSQDQPSLTKTYNVVIKKFINKDLNMVYFKSCRSVNGSGSGGGSSDMSDMTCHKCGKRFYINKDYRSKGNGSGGNQPKKYTNKRLEWVTKNPAVSDTKYLTTYTMTRNNKNYKCCISCNNGQGAWGFHWKGGHEEWKTKQGKNSSVCFSNPSTNAIIYCYYLMNISEDSTEE